jgi:hypothetical protein
MKIEIRQEEIELAIRQHIAEMGIIRNVESITFAVSRNPTEISAVIELTSMKGKSATPLQAVRNTPVVEAEDTYDDRPAETLLEVAVEKPTDEETEFPVKGNSLFGS